jgi:hypothetical protein
MRKYLLAFGAIFFLLSISAWAQSGGATINVPFSFTVNGTAFPAGNYDIRMSGIDRFMTIENRETGHKALVQFRHIALRPDKIQQSTRLIFTKENNHYVLHQVRVEGDLHTHDLIHMDITEPATGPDDEVQLAGGKNH